MKKFLVALAFVVGACSSSPVSSVDAQKTVYAVKAGYAAALTVAVAYNERVRCGKPTSPVICSDQAVVDQMRKADAATSASINAAESAVRSLSSSPSAVEEAVKAAQAALKSYQAVIAVYSPAK